MVVNREAFRQDSVPYLGWYLKGEPGPLGSGKCSYVVNEHRGSGLFRLLVDVSALVSFQAERYLEGLRLGLLIGKGKIFLGTWRQGYTHEVVLPITGSLGGQEIREAILRGLYRLYERDFQHGDSTVDLDGVSLELGVKRVLVDRAVDYLIDEGLVEEFGTSGQNRKTGDFWLTTSGVKFVEQLVSSKTSVAYATKTIMFTDAEGSTKLTEEIGDEGARRLLRENNSVTRETIHVHGGQEVKNMGDGLMAVFASATDAVRSAVAIQTAIHARREGRTAALVKIGISAGDPLEEDNDYFGHVVNLAARLCDFAKGGQIVVSAVVRELAAGQKFKMNQLDKLNLKGIEKPVDAFSVVWRADQKIESPLRAGDRG